MLLGAFFKDVRKKTSEEYEPETLTCLQRSIQRSLNTHESQVNLIQGDEFKLSREVLSAKRKQLVVPTECTSNLKTFIYTNRLPFSINKECR